MYVAKTKALDQLRGYREADLCLCFRKSKKPVFSQRGSNKVHCLFLHEDSQN